MHTHDILSSFTLMLGSFVPGSVFSIYTRTLKIHLDGPNGNVEI